MCLRPFLSSWVVRMSEGISYAVTGRCQWDFDEFAGFVSGCLCCAVQAAGGIRTRFLVGVNYGR